MLSLYFRELTKLISAHLYMQVLLSSLLTFGPYLKYFDHINLTAQITTACQSKFT